MQKSYRYAKESCFKKHICILRTQNLQEDRTLSAHLLLNLMIVYRYNILYQLLLIIFSHSIIGPLKKESNEIEKKYIPLKQLAQMGDGENSCWIYKSLLGCPKFPKSKFSKFISQWKMSGRALTIT